MSPSVNFVPLPTELCVPILDPSFFYNHRMNKESKRKSRRNDFREGGYFFCKEDPRVLQHPLSDSYTDQFVTRN